MRWGYRSTLYKATLCILFIVFLVFLLSFAVPTWIGLDSGNKAADYFMGLWIVCRTVSDDFDFDNCEEYGFGDGKDWMDGVRGVWLAGALFYVIAIMWALLENCNCVCGEDKKDCGAASALALLAGLCGGAGIIVLVIETSDNDAFNDYRWGFIIACISTGLTIILSIVLFITRNLSTYNEKEQQGRTADYVYGHKGPYQRHYSNQGYTRDDIPLSNGVSHHFHHNPHQYSMYRGGDHPAAPPTYVTSVPPPHRNQPYSYSPYGYEQRPYNQRHSMAESADLSNGYTTEMIHAEHSLNRNHSRHHDPRHDYPMGGRY